MSGESTRKRVQAVLFAAVMIVSMVAAGVGGFAGSVAAQDHEVTVDDLSDLQSNVSDGGVADAGDTIIVEEGDYTSDGITVTLNNITIRAANNQNPSIKLTNNNQFKIDSDNVSIRGISITRPDDGNSLLSVSGDSVTIEENNFEGGPIGIGGSGDISVINNTLSGTNPANGHAIFITANSVGEVLIEENGLTEWTSPRSDASAPNNAFADVLVQSDVESLNSNNNLEQGATEVLGDNTDVNSVNLEADGITATGPGDTIQDAVDRSSQGYTILVESGTYNENIQIEHGIDLIGSGPSQTSIAPSSGRAIDIRAQVSNVENLTIEGFSLSVSDNSIVVQSNSQVNDGYDGVNYTYRDLIIDSNGNAQSSVGLFDVKNATLDNVTVRNSTPTDKGAVEMIGVRNLSVINSRIVNNTIGVRMLSLDSYAANENVTIENTDISGNSETGVQNDDTDTTIDATSNWWGSASGPAEEDLAGNITVEPWLNGPIGEEDSEVAVTAILNGEEFSSIQSAVSAAEDGDTVTVQPGVHSDNITVPTPNVTVDGQGTAVIDGRIDIPADEVTVTNLTVRNGARRGSEAEGIFIGLQSGEENYRDLDGDITLRNVVVEDVHGHGTGKTVEGVHVKYYDGDDEIDGITFDNLTVRNVTQTAAGADGVKLQAEVDDVSITNSTFSDIEGRWAYGVVSTPSKLETGVPDDVMLRQNAIKNVTATEYSGVGIGIDGGNGNGYADASDVRATQNDFLNNDVDILNKEPDGGPMFAPLNYFGDDAPNVTGRVVYDPVLTTSEENVAADSPRNVSEYGSVLELQSDGSRALTVGFSARPDEPVGEIFGEMDITGNAFVYDNDAGEYEDITGDYVPSVGEVVVLTSEGSIDETVTVPIETDVDNEAATPESVSLNNGWNLVATGGTVGFDSSTLDIAGAEVQNNLQLQAQPGQPGLAEGEDIPPSEAYTGAFEGTWLFVDDEPNSDAQLATGYAEDQSAEEYVFEVVYPNDPQAEYPPVPIRPGLPPELIYPPEYFDENPDVILAEENTDG